MEPLLVLVLLLVVVAGAVATAAVVGTRRAVRALRTSSTVRLTRELGGYAALAVGTARHPSRTDRPAAVLAARITAATVTLRREVGLARRSGAHLGEVPAVLPRLTDEAHTLTRALRLAATTVTGPPTELVEAAGAHLTVLSEVTAAVRASSALPDASGGVRTEATRVAADLQAYAGAYRDLVRPADHA